MFFGIFVLLLIQIVGANYYVADVYFTVPDTVYEIDEQIELKGLLMRQIIQIMEV